CCSPRLVSVVRCSVVATTGMDSTIWCTVRTLCSKSSRLKGLTRYSRAPASIERRSTSGSLSTDIMMTPVFARRARMVFVASMPSMPGILTSISTTVGSLVAVISIASRPLLALPTISMSGSNFRSRSTLSRLSWTSSTIRTLIFATLFRSSFGQSDCLRDHQSPVFRQRVHRDTRRFDVCVVLRITQHDLECPSFSQESNELRLDRIEIKDQVAGSSLRTRSLFDGRGDDTQYAHVLQNCLADRLPIDRIRQPEARSRLAWVRIHRPLRVIGVLGK